MAELWEGEEKLVLIRDENGRPWKKYMGDIRDVVHECVCALGKREAFGETFQAWRSQVLHLGGSRAPSVPTPGHSVRRGIG
jgi:hypothetical protein